MGCEDCADDGGVNAHLRWKFGDEGEGDALGKEDDGDGDAGDEVRANVAALVRAEKAIRPFQIKNRRLIHRRQVNSRPKFC